MSYQSRSTNPYIMEKKLNATMAQDIIDIKGSLNSINDKLPRISVYTQISKENVTISASSYTIVSFDITPVQGYIPKALVYMSNSNSHDIVPVTCSKLLQGAMSTNLEVRNLSNSNVTTTIYAIVIWEIV